MECDCRYFSILSSLTSVNFQFVILAAFIYSAYAGGLGHYGSGISTGHLAYGGVVGTAKIARVSYVRQPVISTAYVKQPVVSYVARPVKTVSYIAKPVVSVSHAPVIAVSGLGGSSGHGSGWW